MKRLINKILRIFGYHLTKLPKAYKRRENRIPGEIVKALGKKVKHDESEIDEILDRICINCGLTYGAHRADNVCQDQCPDHERKMDWSKEHITTFLDSGRLAKIPYGTPRK